MKREYGFTLIELMIAMAVLAIVAGFGVPKLSALIQNNRLIAEINLFSAELQYARSEAIRRTGDVVVSPNENNWSKGLTIYIDQNGNGSFDNGTDTPLRITPALNHITVTGPASNIVFSSDGFAGATSNFTIPDSRAGKNYTITVTPSGSTKVKSQAQAS
ncbi:MAG: GspH/FimT family pseudopilin [Gammaproteobacteria bacterium]|nr:GspH/FimT family pseudopilin [Gammaproteobacteria bacterium]